MPHRSLSARFGFGGPDRNRNSGPDAEVTHAALGISAYKKVESHFEAKSKAMDGGKKVDPSNPDDCMELAALGETSGRLSSDSCFYLRVWALKEIHKRNLNEKGYDSDIDDLRVRMEAMLKQEDPIITDARGNLELRRKLEERQQAMFEELHLKYDLEDMLRLYQSDRKEYYAKAERGKQQIWTTKPDLEKIAAIQEQFEKEAEACEKVKAYHAAAIMIGSALESSLLLACLKFPEETERAKNDLPKKLQSKCTDPRRWALGQLISVTTEAGWIGERMFMRIGAQLDGKEIAEEIKGIRNTVHPGLQLRTGSLKCAELEYAYVYEAYITIKWLLSNKGSETIRADKKGPPPTRTPYHSTEGTSYHTCVNCSMGNEIKPEHFRYGHGDRTEECWLCEYYRVRGTCKPFE